MTDLTIHDNTFRAFKFIFQVSQFPLENHSP